VLIERDVTADLKELFGLEENRPFAAQVLPITLPRS